MPNKVLDKADARILAELQKNSRISNIDLAEAVGLSPSPCLRRVKQLEESGVINRFVCIVDSKKVGLPISVFINVSLKSQKRVNLDRFEEQISEYPEVMNCYLMTGEFDYLLRVVVADLSTYESFLADKLTRIDGVSAIQSSLTLKQVVYKTELPIS